MIEELNRRTFLGTLGTTVVLGLAGCGYREPVRKLSFREVVVEEHEDGWRVSFDVVNIDEASDELAAFHDVRVHLYGREQTEVCSEYIGTVTGDRNRNNGIPMELTCPEFPTMITYSAAESPCSEVATVIYILIYDEEDGWLVSRTPRKCGEGLPPEPRDE